jgi:hypothetical protein
MRISNSLCTFQHTSPQVNPKQEVGMRVERKIKGSTITPQTGNALFVVI